MSSLRCVLASVAAFSLAASAHAGTVLSFENITGNNATNAAIGESQLRVEIDAFAAGIASFRFFHDGSDPASITDIYFENSPNVFTGINGVLAGPGTSFSPGAAPPILPGGSDSPIFFDAVFSLDSDGGPGGVSGNGIEPGEELTVLMDLNPGVTIADLLAAFDAGLRIGLHVQSMGETADSESFITRGPPPVVPLPTGGAMALVGLGLVGARRRRVRTPAGSLTPRVAS